MLELNPSKLVILDRDGVINHDSDAYIKSPEEWIAIPGSLEAISRLNQAGYQVAIATNQSGIARGYYDLDTLAAIHQKMTDQLTAAGGELVAIYFCPHGPDDNCDCRKPKAGLYRKIQQQLGLESLEGVPVVGDSLRDLQAGEEVGCTLNLVRTGKGEKTQFNSDLPEPASIFDDLSGFADKFLKQQHPSLKSRNAVGN